MPQFLRTGFKPDRWYVYPEIEWLAPGELQAMAISDLRPNDNSLSVFEVDDAANVERIVIAISAGKDDLEEVGYAIFDGTRAAAQGIQIAKTPGGTPDNVVNALHYSLCQLTVTQLADLARIIADGWVLEMLPKRVKELTRTALLNGDLDPVKLKPKLRAKLQ